MTGAPRRRSLLHPGRPPGRRLRGLGQSLELVQIEHGGTVVFAIHRKAAMKLRNRRDTMHTGHVSQLSDKLFISTNWR